VKSFEVKIEKFNLDDFIEDKKSRTATMKTTKREVRKLADSLGLDYTEKDIVFGKKLLNAYFVKR